MGPRLGQALLRRGERGSADETLAMRGLRGSAHDATGDPLAGLLGDGGIDRAQLAEQALRVSMAGGGQPSEATVLVAGVPTAE